MATQSIAPAAPDPTPPLRPILGIVRQTGEFVALVPSGSQPGVYHLVTQDGRCSCRGFQYRQRCRHTTVSRHATPLSPRQADAAIAAANRLSDELERRARNARLAAEIWGQD